MAAKQKAGDNSLQLNAEHDNIIIQGHQYSVADIQNIAKSEIQIALPTLRAEAIKIYENKADSMVNKLLEEIRSDPKKMAAFVDPDFNFALKDAGRAVASNDNKYTEELLVEILSSRATFSQSTKVKIITKKAIDAADKLSVETLNALTTLWALLSIHAESPVFTIALPSTGATMSKSFASFNPPKPDEWVEEAELLGLVTSDQSLLSSKMTFIDLIAKRFAKQLVQGIDAARWTEINQQLQAIGIDLRINILEHPLKEGFVIVDHDDEQSLRAAITVPKSKEEVANPLIEEVIRENGFGSVDGVAKSKLEELINKHPDFKLPQEWWNGLPVVRLTATGNAIAYLHARKFLTFNGPQTLQDYLQM